MYMELDTMYFSIVWRLSSNMIILRFIHVVSITRKTFLMTLDVFFVLGHDSPGYDNHMRTLIAADVIWLIQKKLF